MQTKNTQVVKSPCFMSSGLPLHISVLYMACTALFVIILIIPAQFFPDLVHEGWFLVWYILWMIGMLLPFIVVTLCKIHVSSNEVNVTVAGTVMRTIPASRLQLIALAGNDQEDVLCLSTLTMAELAQKEEQTLLKNYFTKYDVPLRKGNQNWEAAFAKDYFNRLRRIVFGVFFNKDVILLPAHPSLQYLLQNMHPQLPYYNFTENKSAYPFIIVDNTVPNFPRCVLHIKEDGIHISSNKTELWYMPATHIRTIVRVERFTGYALRFWYFTPVFIVSCLTLEELAQSAPSQIYGIAKSQQPNHIALFAAHYCLQQLPRWTRKQQNFCPMHATPENEALLRKSYPQAQWVDLSELLKSDIG